MIYKHAQDNHIHVYKFGSHGHAPRHVSSKQNIKLKEASLGSNQQVLTF